MAFHESDFSVIPAGMLLSTIDGDRRVKCEVFYRITGYAAGKLGIEWVDVSG